MRVHMYYYQQDINNVKATDVSASRNVSYMAPFIPHTMKERSLFLSTIQTTLLIIHNKYNFPKKQNAYDTKNIFNSRPAADGSDGRVG